MKSIKSALGVLIGIAIGCMIIFSIRLNFIDSSQSKILQQIKITQQSIKSIKTDSVQQQKKFEAEIRRQLDNQQAKDKQNWKFWNEFFIRKGSE